MSLRLAGAIGLSIVLSGHAQAADTALASTPTGLSVTGADVIADAQRMPPELRAKTLGVPANVAQIAQTVLIARALAAEAEQAQLDKDPKVVALLRLARERVLAEARLAQAEGDAPSRDALERLARVEYQAQPEKYDAPEQIRASHLLIDARSCEADKRIAQLLEQARAKGADFAALAREHSQDPGSASRGGDLGFFSRGSMTAEFEKAAFALKNPGDLSGVVRTEFGLHIIRLEERKPAARQPFEKVRDAMIQDLASREARKRRFLPSENIGKSLQFDRAAIDAFADQPH